MSGAYCIAMIALALLIIGGQTITIRSMLFGHYVKGTSVVAQNTAEDFTAADSCKGAWLMFDDGLEASAKLDRCDGAGQNGADDLSLVAPGDEDLNLVSSWAPAGSAPGADSIHFIRRAGDLNETHYSGPDETDDAFESNAFTIVYWIRPDGLSGNRGTTFKGSIGDEGNWTIHQTNGEQKWFLVESDTTQHQSPTSDELVLIADTAAFVAISLDLDDGTRKMRHYSSMATAANTLLACDDGVRDCAIAPAITISHAAGAKMGIGASGSTRPFDGEMHEFAYIAEKLTDEDVCSICRCGLEGANSGTTQDRSALCNDCALPGAAVGCGLI